MERLLPHFEVLDQIQTPNIERISSVNQPERDTVENVQNQTDGIFRSFVGEMNFMESTHSELNNFFPELDTFLPERNSVHQQIGQRLAIIGDDVNQRYNREMDNIISQLNFSDECAYDIFASIANQVFRNGINWGRIVTLLVFGYRLALTMVRRGVHGFFSKIISFFIQFVREQIGVWIANAGGWRSVLEMVIGEKKGVIFVAVLATVCALFAIYFNN